VGHRESLSEPADAFLDWALDPSGRRLLLDWVVVTLAVTAHALIAHWRKGGDVLGWSKPPDRDSFYATADTVVGIIVGFTIAAMAFFYSIEPGRRLGYVQSIGSDQLRRAWLSAITAPLLGVLIFTLGLLLDNPDVHDAGIRWVCEWAALMVAVRFTRLIWLFARLLRTAAEDRRQPAELGKVGVLGPRAQRSGG